MILEEFAEKVRLLIAGLLGEQYEVAIHRVQKNNGVSRLGLRISGGGSCVAPAIYLEEMWQAYENGETMMEIVGLILKLFREKLPAEEIDFTFFKSFDKVKDRIGYRLIHAGRNSELLERVPYVPLMDLAICFFYAYDDGMLGKGSILIENAHMNMWQTDTAALYECAEKNMAKLYEPEIYPLEQELELFVLTNHEKFFGASCILYPNVLEELADKFGKDMYVIPSSVHEVLLLPADNRGEEQLKEMICEVNRTQVALEDILSDSLYYYSRSNKSLINLSK